MSTVLRGCLGGVLALSVSTTVLAQDSKSAPLARDLAAALDAAKLDSIAAKDSSKSGVYISALYFPGAQLLVVTAEYAVPQYLDEKLAKKDYREIYLDLNSASVPESKAFFEDLGADGLKVKRDENRPFDTYEAGGRRVMFDSDWRRQKLTEDEYTKAFSAADEQYSRLLSALLAQAKK